MAIRMMKTLQHDIIFKFYYSSLLRVSLFSIISFHSTLCWRSRERINFASVCQQKGYKRLMQQYCFWQTNKNEMRLVGWQCTVSSFKPLFIFQDKTGCVGIKMIMNIWQKDNYDIFSFWIIFAIDLPSPIIWIFEKIFCHNS